jgi:hypothetical protein
VFAGKLSTPGTTDGSLLSARFNTPKGLATDSSGNLYVATAAGRVRKISPAGSVTTYLGLGSAGQLEQLAVRENEVYASDPSRHVIYRYRESSAEVFAGVSGQSTSTSLSPLLSEGVAFNQPKAIAVNSSGVLYVGDSSTTKKITIACPVSPESGMQQVFPIRFSAGGACHAYFRAFSGAFSASNPILRLRTRDLASNQEGESTPMLSWSGAFPNPAPMWSGNSGDSLIYNSTLTTALTVSSTQLSGGGSWVLNPGGKSFTLIQVKRRSSAGTSEDQGGITLSPTQVTFAQRSVNGAPMEEAEIVLLVNTSPPEYRKQRLRFTPVNPSQIQTRLKYQASPVGSNFVVCASESPGSWSIEAELNGILLPLTTSGTKSSAVFSLDSGSSQTLADYSGVFSYIAATGGNLSITATAVVKGLEEITAPSITRSGTVSTAGGCTFNGGSSPAPSPFDDIAP